MSKRILCVEPLIAGYFSRLYDVVLSQPDQLRPIHPSIVADSRATFQSLDGAQTVDAQLCTYGGWRWWVVEGGAA